MAMSLFEKQLVLTKDNFDGVSQLQAGTAPINFGFSGQNVNTSNQTGTQESTALPFSNFGISIGVRYDL